MNNDLIKAAVYNTPARNGVYEIDSVMVGTAATIAANLERGQAYEAVTGDVDDARHYLDHRRRLRARPVTTGRTYAESVAVANPLLIDQLQNPTTIVIRGPIQDQVTVANDRLELTFARPGAYELTLTADFPARPITLTIDAI